MFNYFHRKLLEIEERKMEIKATKSDTTVAYIIYKYLIVYLELFKWFIPFITRHTQNND